MQKGKYIISVSFAVFIQSAVCKRRTPSFQRQDYSWKAPFERLYRAQIGIYFWNMNTQEKYKKQTDTFEHPKEDKSGNSQAPLCFLIVLNSWCTWSFCIWTHYSEMDRT